MPPRDVLTLRFRSIAHAVGRSEPRYWTFAKREGAPNLRAHMTPLQLQVTEALRDSTSALAALMVSSNFHSELFAWTASVLAARPCEEAPKARPALKTNGAHKRASDGDPYLEPSLRMKV